MRRKNESSSGEGHQEETTMTYCASRWQFVQELILIATQRTATTTEIKAAYKRAALKVVLLYFTVLTVLTVSSWQESWKQGTGRTEVQGDQWRLSGAVRSCCQTRLRSICSIRWTKQLATEEQAVLWLWKGTKVTTLHQKNDHHVLEHWNESGIRSPEPCNPKNKDNHCQRECYDHNEVNDEWRLEEVLRTWSQLVKMYCY